MAGFKHQFTGTGVSRSERMFGDFNFTIRRIGGPFVATIALERSLDGGATFDVVGKDPDGAEAVYTDKVSLAAKEPAAKGALYRANCTSYTSGTAEAEISD